MGMESALRCPFCGDDSNIAKVSGVYRTRNSQLSSLLAPPAESVYVGDVGKWVAVALAVAVAGVLLPTFGPFAIGIFLIVLFIGMIIAAIVTRVIESIISASRRSEYYRVLQLWETAYYCRKHDAVFLTGESKTYSPTEFQRLLTW